MATHRERTHDLIRQLAAHLSTESGVLAGYLFGSCGEGRAHRESDVDVAVLLDRSLFPDARDRFEARMQIAAGLIAASRCNELDLVVLNDAPPLFARRIVLDGIRVFCTDQDAEHAFRRDVQLRSADIAPFLERTRKTKLEALAR